MGKKRKGINPLIAAVFSIAIAVMMLVIVLGVIGPTMKRATDSAVVADAFQNLELINSGIKEVASEAQGSKRTISVSVSGGQYRINSTYDWLYFEYDPQHDMHLTGTRGDIKIERGLVILDYFNWYADGAKATPTWANTSGEWTVSNLKYLGQGGLTYHNLTLLENYEFSGRMTNISGSSTGGQIFVSPVNPARLVGFWPFDNRTGSKAYDFSGNQNNGTLTNMNTTGNSTSGWQDAVDCKAGSSCLMFDGVNDYVSTTVTGLTASEGSIGLWLKPGVIDTNYHYAFALNGNNFSLLMNNDATNLVYYHDDAQVSTAAHGWTAGEWHHIIATYKTGGTCYLYIDGNFADSGSCSASDLSLGTLYIGAYQGDQKFFSGTIDEVKLWNVSLSAGQAAAEYELSSKKLFGTGGSQSISAKANASIVLVNPDGQTQFDDIKVNRDNKEQIFIIPYTKIDLNGTISLPKGEHHVVIEHMGINTTYNKPTVQITKS